MRLFSCDVCHQQLYFESSRCTNCGSGLGFLASLGLLTALQRDSKDPTVFNALVPAANMKRVRFCSNARHGACNWLVSESETGLCSSCSLSVVIPDVSEESSRQAWISLEKAKRRLLYTLYALKLPVESRQQRPRGLAFRLLESTPSHPVLTGHADGVITINVEEANHSFREYQRELLGEGYRTTLGHFRHESGHYYFLRLVEGTTFHSEFRELFGDERADYGAAIERHYGKGPDAFWSREYISSYASMHPAEDWAETWAHYLHMVDTLDTAQSYAIAINGPTAPKSGLPVPPGSPSTEYIAVHGVNPSNFDELVAAWVPLTLALNSLNRSMGLRDAYPFSLSKAVQRKLRFVHDLTRSTRLSAQSK